MAGETLKTISELLNAFPDNLSGWIEAVESRDLILSMAPAVGFLSEAVPPFTVGIVAQGVPVSINAAIPAPNIDSNFWQLDGNNSWIPDYPAGVIIPPAYERLSTLQSWLVASRDAAGIGENYSFQWNVGAALVGAPLVVNLDQAPVSVVMPEEILYDVSVGDPIGLTVANLDSTTDLLIDDDRQSVVSVAI